MSELVPQHLAIIMDGNGRWAKKQNKPRSYGHYMGTENVRNIAIAANHAGVKYLTLYAFSTENWIRPKEEINYLMGIPAIFFDSFLKELMANNIKITTIGQLDAFPESTRKVFDQAIKDTAGNTGMILNFAMNYGGRKEIVLAVQKIIEDKLPSDQINEETIGKYLMTSDLPDVDYLIRTSGEYRISNFLLWQIAYAEMYFTDVLWPDFDEQQLHLALDEYKKRHRRFGGLDHENQN